MQSLILLAALGGQAARPDGGDPARSFGYDPRAALEVEMGAQEYFTSHEFNDPQSPRDRFEWLKKKLRLAGP